MRSIVAGTAILALLFPAVPAIADPPSGAGGAASAHGVARAERPAERVDNLRLQRVTDGPMRGRLIVAGSLDHIGEMDEARVVTVRMALSVPRRNGGWRTIGTNDMDYRLPPRVSPQDMTLRWVLSPVRSRIVTRAGDAARLSVVVRESGTPAGVVTHRKTVKSLRIEPLFVPPSHGATSRASTMFIPGGFYGSDEDATFYLWTAEDATGAPYVGGAGYSVNDPFANNWSLEPLWTWQGADSGSPGPGGGYVYMNGPVPSWSMSTLFDPYCTITATISGTFSGTTGAAMTWNDIYCAPGSPVHVWAGGASLYQLS
jgi:hypothetical protein